MENYTMHRQWASRPADERYATLADMYARLAAETRQCGTAVLDTAALRVTKHADGDLALVGPTGNPAALSHWSLSQLAGIAKAPATYIRSLPNHLAADCLNHGLSVQARESHQLFLRSVPNGRDSYPGTDLQVRAITSPGYTRIHTAAIVKRLQELTDRQPDWRAPEVYARGDFGGQKQPCVGFAGDRDAYITLVNDTVRIDDPTDPSGQGLMRGLMLVNSEVGAKRLDLTCFLCRYVCGNYIIWGYRQIASFSMRHYGDAIRRSWSTGIGRTFADYASLSAHDETETIRQATRKELGPTKDDVIELLFKRFDIGKQQAADAYALAERYEQNPRSAWGAVQGLSRLSQLSQYADERIDLDRAAAKILDF